MGIIKQAVPGGFSGKVGTVIGSSWKGIAVMRGLTIANQDKHHNHKSPCSSGNGIWNRTDGKDIEKGCPAEEGISGLRWIHFLIIN